MSLQAFLLINYNGSTLEISFQLQVENTTHPMVRKHTRVTISYLYTPSKYFFRAWGLSDKLLPSVICP